MLSIIKQYDLPNEFPRKVLLETEKVSKEKIKLGNRMDFRGERTFTIDGDEAKDLDDAISIKKYKRWNILFESTYSRCKSLC